MSQADAHFCCSICLELFREPVTVPCGHSFCMSCLGSYWDQQPLCSCPECRTSFNPRPKLGRNNLLVEMINKLGSTTLNDGPSAPPMHEVLDPGEYHALFESSVGRRRNAGKKLLDETRKYLHVQIKEKETEHRQLKEGLTSFSALTKAAVKDISSIFSQLIDFLERSQLEMKELLRAQEKAEVTRAENQLQVLQLQISELQKRDNELEKLSYVQDQKLITQTCQAFRNPVAAETGTLLMVSPHVSFRPVRSAISSLKEQLQSVYEKEYTNITSAVKSVNLLQMKRNRKALEFGLSPVPHSRTDLLQYFCPLSVDPFSVHPELSLTDRNRVISRNGQIQDYPDHPDRFDMWSQALCREALQGCCYWEAEWDGLQVGLGVAYEDIKRKGSSNEVRLGHNLFSWILQCSSSSLTVCHGDQKHPLKIPCNPPSRRVGVFLDFDAGLLCFFMVTHSEVHLLHQEKAEFRQPLYAAVWLGNKTSITFWRPS